MLNNINKKIQKEYQNLIYLKTYLTPISTLTNMYNDIFINFILNKNNCNFNIDKRLIDEFKDKKIIKYTNNSILNEFIIKNDEINIKSFINKYNKIEIIYKGSLMIKNVSIDREKNLYKDEYNITRNDDILTYNKIEKEKIKNDFEKSIDKQIKIKNSLFDLISNKFKKMDKKNKIINNFNFKGIIQSEFYLYPSIYPINNDLEYKYFSLKIEEDKTNNLKTLVDFNNLLFGNPHFKIKELIN